jgi:hypothetical protein
MNNALSRRWAPRHPHLLGWLCGLLATTPFIVLLRDGYYAFDVDVLIYTMPLRAVAAQALSDGFFPLWDAYTQCGQSLAANPASAIFYPLFWLFLGDGGWTGFAAYCIAHYFLLGWFAYLFFVLGMRCRPLAACFGAIMVACSGYWFSMFYAMRIVTFPWLLLTGAMWLHSLRERRADSAIAAGLALALAFVAGSMQHVMVALALLLLGTAMYALRGAAERYCGARTVILAGVVAFSLCLIPMQQIMRGHAESGRGGGLDYATATNWSLSPMRTLEFALPYVWGVPHPGEAYVGGRIRQAQKEGNDLEWAPAIFMGTACLFLLGLPVHRRRRRAAMGAWVLSGAALYLALGSHAPGHRALFEALPLLAIFRYPQKWLVWLNLGLAMLAAMKLEALGISLRRRRWARLRMLTLPALTLVALWLVTAILPMDRLDPAIVARNARSIQLLVLAFIAIGISATLRRGTALLLLALLIGETQRVNHMRPPAIAMPDPLQRDGLAADLTEMDHYRVVRQTAPVESAPAQATVSGFARHKTRGLQAATAAIWGLRTTAGLHPNATARFLQLDSVLNAYQQYDKLGIITHARYVAHRIKPGEYDGFPVLAEDPDYGVLLFENPQTPPRIRVLSHWTTAPTRAQAADLLGQLPLAVFTDGALIEGGPEPAGGSPKLEILEERSGRVVAEIANDQLCLFYYGDCLAPGWRAWVDGETAEILPANLAFMAVPVPPGRHRVELRYCWY